MSATIFKNIPSKVGDLVHDVITGRIGLPDLQRPFVWRDNKVRELLDSMIKGFPIGYVMLWESPSNYAARKSSIGSNEKTYDEPKELVIDGQQRLTALAAAMYGVKVKDTSRKLGSHRIVSVINSQTLPILTTHEILISRTRRRLSM